VTPPQGLRVLRSVDPIEQLVRPLLTLLDPGERRGDLLHQLDDPRYPVGELRCVDRRRLLVLGRRSPLDQREGDKGEDEPGAHGDEHRAGRHGDDEGDRHERDATAASSDIGVRPPLMVFRPLSA
jgi:hypothetical protein